MGGRGSGFFSRTRTPEKIQQLVRGAEARAVSAEFEGKVNETLGALLSEYNSRDSALMQSRLGEIKETIKEELEETVDTIYGGSVAKHTYVDGVSDVDSLAVLNATHLASKDPSRALAELERVIVRAVGRAVSVEKGRIALTLKYPDGMTLQILPAIRTESGLRVPSWRGSQWSEIDPEKFTAGLRKRNEQCAGKLVPTIKLVKAINASASEDQQLSGYHIESLAIASFRGYNQPCTYTRMLQHFYERSSALVLTPITDRTGQSVNVDSYLGPSNSAQRQVVAQSLTRTAKRIRNANAAQSVDQWNALFE